MDTTLEARIDKLERSNRRLRLATCVVALAAGLAFTWMVQRTGSASPGTDELRVRRLVLQGDGTVGELTSEHLLLGKLDEEQGMWPLIMTADDGLSPSLTFSADSGRTFIRAGTAEFGQGTDGLEIDGGPPGLTMLRNATPDAKGPFGQADIGADFVRFIGEAGRASLSAQGHAHGLTVTDPKGSVVVRTPK